MGSHMAGRSSPIAVERKRQRIDLALQSMKDSAELLNPGKRRLNQCSGLAGALVDPDNKVLFKITQRRGDLLVVLDLRFQDANMPQMFFERVWHHWTLNESDPPDLGRSGLRIRSSQYPAI